MSQAWKSVPLPERMKNLRRDHRGYPVPEFVQWIKGKPDFRVASAAHLRDCIRYGLATECRGHPAGPFDPMGETVYCDGSCRSTKPRDGVRGYERAE